MFTDKERMQELICQGNQRRKKRNFKILGIILAMVLFLTAIVPSIKAGNFIKKYGKEIYHLVGVVEERKTIKFGKYEQDNNLKNGKEDIEWYVLRVEDGRALVISKYVLDTQKYHTESADVSWRDASIRVWLNTTFINSAFSREEQAVILASEVPVIQNDVEQTEPDDRTEDKIFLLNKDEAWSYFDVFEDIALEHWYRNLTRPNRGPCRPTKYAKAKGVCMDSVGKGYCYWWSRNDEALSSSYCFIMNGTMSHEDVARGDIGVRPALWINLKP